MVTIETARLLLRPWEPDDIGLDELPHWPGPDKVKVGWELHPALWGRGLATEGGRAGVRHGLATVAWYAIDQAEWRAFQR